MRKGNEGKDSNESEGTERVRRDDMRLFCCLLTARDSGRVQE